MRIRLLMLSLATFVLVTLNCGKDKSTEPSENRAPSVPTIPSPSNGATDVATNATFSWQCSDPDDDPLTYDIYLEGGTAWLDNPVLFASNVTATTFDPESLHAELNYSWRVVAKDGHEHQTTSAIWQFSTAADIVTVGIWDDPGYSTWVWEAVVSGTRAYLCDGPGGLVILDVSNPANPVFESRCLANQHGVFGIAVQGNYAYLTYHELSDPMFSGLQIVDVSSPQSPTTVGRCSAYPAQWEVFVSGDYAYVANDNVGLDIINVADPTHPFIVGTCDTPDRAIAVHVEGNYAFVADRRSGLQVVDVSNPGNPIIVGAYTNVSFANDVYISDGYAFLTDYDDSLLQIINISDPASPTLTGNFNAAGPSAHGVFVRGSRAYVATTYSLQIVDIIDPAHPRLMTQSNQEGQAVFVDDSYIYLSQHYNGFRILRYAP